jgi:hypothetical protein
LIRNFEDEIRNVIIRKPNGWDGKPKTRTFGYGTSKIRHCFDFDTQGIDVYGDWVRAHNRLVLITVLELL